MDPKQRPVPSPTDEEEVSVPGLSRGELLHFEELELPPPKHHPRPGLRRHQGAQRRPRRTLLRLFLANASKVLIVLVLAWGLLFNFSEVRGSSMEPGIHDRDRILVDQVSYLFRQVQRGDVVVLRYPLDPSLDYIKRVIGLPGDEVRIERGRVFINDQRLDEPYVDAASIEPWTSMQTTVRPGHYFVLGDNRKRSSDSREFGQVAEEFLRGKVRLKLWPPERLGWIR